MQEQRKNVEVKLCDDSTGKETVISVPGPEEEDENEVEMDINTIARVAFAIRKHRLKNKSENEIREMFPEFPKQYPVLFGKCCDLSFSMGKLDFLLRQLDALRSNRKNKDQATDSVMEELNRTYVDGVVEDLENKRKAGLDGDGNPMDAEKVRQENKKLLKQKIHQAKELRARK